ncbi:MAG: DUF4347 domain-containing protein, partial [Planctomycetota bacterium]
MRHKKGSPSNYSNKNQKRLSFEQLNPRIVLDASGAVPDLFVDTPQESVAPNHRHLAETSLRREFVFVDSGVSGHQRMLDDLKLQRPHVQLNVHRIDGDANGLEQISSALAGHTSIDAIHIISHGRSGEL